MKRAFTLIEMMVVICIIGILASMLLFGVSIGQKKSKEIKCVDIVQTITKGLESYNNENFSFPPDTHTITVTGTDPEIGLHPLNCDSLIRYLAPTQAKAKGYNDPRQLGTEDFINIPEQYLLLHPKLKKWVVVDPWKRPLIYDNNSDETGSTPPIYNIHSYDLHSAGPNGKDELGKGDDIPQVK
jgi:prepilin-type N-terminal cleavage/methylation domain-containing protein